MQTCSSLSFLWHCLTSKVRNGGREEIPHVQDKRNPSKRVGTERESMRRQTDWNYNHRQLANLITWTTALSNSMKLSHATWGHPRLKSLTECGPLEKEMANHFTVLGMSISTTASKWPSQHICNAASPYLSLGSLPVLLFLCPALPCWLKLAR